MADLECPHCKSRMLRGWRRPVRSEPLPRAWEAFRSGYARDVENRRTTVGSHLMQNALRDLDRYSAALTSVWSSPVEAVRLSFAVTYMIEELDLVVFRECGSRVRLEAGDVGTVVLVHQGGKGYEVEFTTLDGETVAIVTLSSRTSGWPEARNHQGDPGEKASRCRYPRGSLVSAEFKSLVVYRAARNG